MAMIDLKTGNMEFNGVKIEKDMCVDDFKQYDDSLVDVDIIRDKNAIITLNQWVVSNGIEAEITITIDEEMNRRIVNIFPGFDDDEDIDLLTASKEWLKGMIPFDEINVSEKAISGSFAWGYIAAQYQPDMHYGETGGDINIVYER